MINNRKMVEQLFKNQKINVNRSLLQYNNILAPDRLCVIYIHVWGATILEQMHKEL